MKCRKSSVVISGFFRITVSIVNIEITPSISGGTSLQRRPDQGWTRCCTMSRTAAREALALLSIEAAALEQQGSWQ
jgi:hypothetical protein